MNAENSINDLTQELYNLKEKLVDIYEEILEKLDKNYTRVNDELDVLIEKATKISDCINKKSNYELYDKLDDCICNSEDYST